jgi:hypothetical protein
MELQLLSDNLSNPALLFFFLGLLAVRLKSDLQIPPTSSKFISMYLLLSIGFKGGQELAHSDLSGEIMWSLFFGIFSAMVIPFYMFFILKRRFGVSNAGAIAATYGSISAVTFVTAVSFLSIQQIEFGGHMVAVMALMEAPAIVVGVLLIQKFKSKADDIPNGKGALKHALTNGSVLLIAGSLVIGFLASDAQAEGIKPFTTDIFKGFLAVFLLDMGITCGKEIGPFIKNGWFAVSFAIVFPLINGCMAALITPLFTDSIGNQFLLTLLAGSGSYIAVPAAMKLAAPKSNPSLYVPMALAITFPFNITLGMPIYMAILQSLA